MQRKFTLMIKPEELMTYENQLREKGYRYICGVDEVGRGPLAGPVTCSAVIMDLDDLIVGVNDSKKVSKGKREKLFDVILSKAIAVSTVSYPPEKIDEMNILNATKACMADAITSLMRFNSIFLTKLSESFTATHFRIRLLPHRSSQR